MFTEGDVFAAVAYPESGASEDALSEALVGLDVERYEIPEAEGSPADHLERLEHRKQQLQSDLESVESELRSLRLEHAGFLLAAEEKLNIEVQKAEAPLSFATTEHAFFAEGWIPTSDYESYASALKDELGERIEVEELERADYEPERDVPAAGFAPAGEEAEGEGKLATDGGANAGTADEPPVVQNNPWFAKPFEVLVQAINRPNYHEIDPTIVLFLTFPLFFGFMIGDIGYGAVYALVGYALYTRVDSEGIRSLGFVAIVAGIVTMVFGILYGEVFGMHLPYVPLLNRGLEPGFADWAELWLLASVLAGLVHLTVGYVFDFVKQLTHGPKDAVLESGSLVVVMLGIWLWVFSKPKTIQPDWLIGTSNVLNGNPVPLGFTGFPGVVGAVGLWMIPIGLVLAYFGGGGIEAYEGLVNSITHVLSYTRLGAEVLAEGGIAFVINLLFFGAYSHEGEYHYLVNQTASEALAHHSEASVMFPGLLHSGVVGIVAGIVVLVLGHLLVLALGITSAGMQAIRLEYVEFFGKFYEGGGKKYEPFGHQRTYTTQD
ncbi:V-type ATP synthase subunit I [Halarchaeum acidiphilum MH1-52-1]|uniref:A-type ATP synthase subunit I n=1 Tax=Halarchaeum acidiphilum MH1-52-1 TaxID=1261545 RepID=U2YFF4_9EURY|nr:V-type ATP synthase subunit I [Halarchaeum acidiphilum MH1-52-1]